VERTLSAPFSGTNGASEDFVSETSNVEMLAHLSPLGLVL
jgi:hypothetical protein